MSSEHESKTTSALNEEHARFVNTDTGISRRRLAAWIVLAISTLLLITHLRANFLGIFPDDYMLCAHGHNIYTLNERQPRVECIAVHKNRIIAVGSSGEVRKRLNNLNSLKAELGSLGIISLLRPFLISATSAVKVYSIKPGHIIVPGLTDGHAHLIEHGFKRQLEVDNCSSVEEAVERVKDYILARPDILHDRDIFIQGMGWDQTRWTRTKFPTAADFDVEPLLRGRRISLRRVDGHALWVSSRVLKEAGELPDTIYGGTIVRDSDGNPTGVFVDNAMMLITLPEWTEKQMIEYYNTAIHEALSFGLTSIHDAATTPQMIQFLKMMADENKLPLRLYLMGYVESDEYWGHQIDRFVNYGPAKRLTLRSIKLFADGALGSWGAALLEPYSDKPGTRGLLRSTPEEMSNMIENFWNDGFQVNIHCIGDRANNIALDTFEKLVEKEDVTKRRPRIEHAQIMTENDLKRIGKIGVIPSVQPTHATSDMWYAESRLGPERVKNAYAYKTLLNYSGHHVLNLGSDFPVESVNPLMGFYAAVSRLSVQGSSPHGSEGWFPEQRLTRAEALKGMTLDSAYASFSENDLGSLESGKLADFVVLDTDIMTVPISDILKAKVLATVVDGRPMYGSL